MIEIKSTLDILFPTKFNRENDGDLYSACSNPTSVVLNMPIDKDARYWERQT
jgi:hypothetical protein